MDYGKRRIKYLYILYQWVRKVWRTTTVINNKIRNKFLTPLIIRIVNRWVHILNSNLWTFGNLRYLRLWIYWKQHEY
jgi:hypothetical protein